MYSNPEARKSVDSLSPVSPHAHRTDFPFHRQSSTSTYGRQRRDSTASSIHSIGGSLDTVAGSWGHAVLEAGQNAISTLLQPPIVRTGLLPHTSAPASSAHKPPTAKDIPPVALTNITHIDSAEFTPYLAQVGALHEQLRRVKENEDEGADILHRRGSRQDDLTDILDDGHLQPGKRPPASRKQSVALISSFSPIEAPSPVRRTSSGLGRRGTQGPPPLSTIPNVYFDEDFHLENPRTFDIVSERSEVVRPAPGSNEEKNAANGKAVAPRKALATNAILQEKLSWYMDTIEMHLISSISTASTTFFTALGSLKELHTEAAESVERIKALRKELEALDQEMATTGLEIVQKQRRQENIQQLHDAVLQLGEVVDRVVTCESFVDAGESSKALDSIDSLERLIAGEQDATTFSKLQPRQKFHLRDLRGATALQGVNDDIGTLRIRIGKDYEAKFLSILMGDLRRHVQDASTQEVLMRWSSASIRARGGHSREPSTFPTYLGSTDDLRTELFCALTGLQKAKHISSATRAFRDSVLREIRSTVRRQLPSSNDDDNESMVSSSTLGSSRQRSNQERSSILSRNLRALEPEDAEELLVKVYTGITETLRRLSTQVKVLLDVASSIGDDSEPDGLKSPPLRSPPFSPTGRKQSAAGLEAQAELHETLDLANLLGQAVDKAQDQVVRVLRVRKDQSTHLPLVWFLRYFTLNLHFAIECEAISGRSGTALKTTVNEQIKDFVQQHGDAEKQKLAQGMESDQWAIRDFGESETALLGRVLECTTKDPQVWSEGSKVWLPYSTEESAEDGEDEPKANGTGKAKTRSAVIETETFLLPNSAVLSLDGMSRFLHLIVGIPSMTADVSTSLISYLQLFDSRCRQLILGAGATRSAGLGKITARHLATASQALAFMAALIPHVREFIRRHAGSTAPVSALMGEFDKVKRLYQEHQNSIYDKLVEIMSGRAMSHSKAMKTIDWDKSSGTVHPYMDALVKETNMLHKNLTKTLPEGTIPIIMIPVFQNYKEQFGRVFREAAAQTESGRDSMLHDVEFFRSRLSNIDGFGDAGDYLNTIIKSKEVRSQASESTNNDESASSSADQPDGSRADNPKNKESKDTESR